jgi:hypothetical protein
MEQYREFKQLDTNQLKFIRKGFFDPVFTLSDGTFIYGKVTLNKWSRGAPVLETANDTWTLTREGKWSKKVWIINNSRFENIGTVSQGDYFLQLKNGFEAIITSDWENNQYGKIVNFKQSSYNERKPYTLTFDTNLAKTLPEMPLLTVLGMFLIFLRQTRSTA